MTDQNTKAKPPGYRRTNFLINPRFQLTIIGFNTALALLMIGVFYFENHYLFKKFTGIDSPDMQVDPIVLELVQTEAHRLDIIFAITAVTVLAAMIIGGMILSHRVAGPVYRLMKHMDEIVEGKHSNNVKFRDKDFFIDMSDSFNRLMDFFRKKNH